MESIILQYSYFALLPLTIIEGPIVTIVASFLASLGHLNIFLVYPLALMGDIIGDIIHYWAGRYGRNNILNRFGITNSKLEQVKIKYFANNQSLWKVLTISKITHAPSSLVMLTAGMLRVDFKQYLLITSIINVFKVFIFVLIGYFFGESYLLIGNYIEHSWILLLPIFLIIVYFIYGRKK